MGAKRAFFGRADSLLFLMATVMSFSALFATGLFIVFNVVLLATNQTTIEFWGNVFGRKRNPFNIGLVRNIRQVFGVNANLITWLLPSRAPPPGNGIVYPMLKNGRIIHEELELKQIVDDGSLTSLLHEV